MIVDMNYWTRVIKRLVILIVSLVFVFLGLKLAIFYIPFLIGFIISTIIEPIIKFVANKTKLTRKTCAVIVLLIIFSILIGAITLGIITIISESTRIASKLKYLHWTCIQKNDRYYKLFWL